MKESGYGRIVNIASAHALVASPYKSAYVAAKHGVAGLTKTVALEAAKETLALSASTKANSEWRFLRHLHELGRKEARAWLDEHLDSVGHESSVDIRSLFD